MTDDVAAQRQSSPSTSMRVDERTPLLNNRVQEDDDDTPADVDKPVSIRRRISTICCCGLTDWRLIALLWVIAISGVSAIVYAIRSFILVKAASLLFQVLSSFSQVSRCGSCFALISTVKSLANLGDAVFVKTISNVCIDLRIQHPDVCRGAIARQGPVIASTLRRISPNKHSASLLCQKLWGMCPTHEIPEDWPAERFPPPLTVPVTQKPANRSGKNLKIVHISDLHVDPQYLPGAEAICDKPLCCRADSTTPGQPVKLPASEFGSSRCDTPPRLLRSMLAEIMRVAPDALFVASTGDILPHNVWTETRESVIAGLRSTYSLMNSDLAMPVFASPGNHDVSPTNDLPRSETNQRAFDRAAWYFEELYNNFAPWIGQHVTRQQFYDQRAHYSVPVSVANLRVISLDTNVNNRESFYQYDSDNFVIEDPESRLQWLIEELTAVELSGQKAIIIGHGASVGFFAQPSHIYWQIINRFNSSIIMQLFGHAHASHFNLYYSSPEDRRAETATSSAFIGGSLTPYGGNNPTFRVYEIDADELQLLDYTDHYVDLQKHNMTGEWSKLYSARDTFGAMVPLTEGDFITPGYLHRVTMSLQSSMANFDKFVSLKYRNGIAAARKCRLNCFRYTLCALTRSRAEDRCPEVPELPETGGHNSTHANDYELETSDQLFTTTRNPLLSQDDVRSIFQEINRRLSAGGRVDRS